MRLNVGVFSAAVVLTCAPFSIAGPLFPCPTAVNSAHGNAIAVAHNTIEWHPGSGKLLSVQFTVMTKMNFVNDSQKISAPVMYWDTWPWAVVLDMNKQADRSFSSCAVPLVTDDAEFLVLLATGPVFDSALRVYRKGDDSSERMQDGTVRGVLVRDIKLEELWPATKIDSSRSWTDHTPEWFAGGSFDFAPGNLQLIHKTRWGTTVRINLPDGETLKDPDLGCVVQIYHWCGEIHPSCELATESILSRSSSGLAQVSNLGDIRIRCRIPARPWPFPTKRGESRNGLTAATTVYEVSADGGKKLVPSEVHVFGGGGDGLGANPEPEYVDFYVHLPLDSEEADAEARRYLAKLEESMTREQKSQLTEDAKKKALENLRPSAYQHRAGHFQVDCRILDGSRVMGTDMVEIEVLFKGRFSDRGLLGSPPA